MTVFGKTMVSIAAMAALAGMLAACNTKGSLAGSSVENMRVDGRLFEIRLASTESANEWRLFIVRATVVIDPEPARERDRARNVARIVMDRTCKGRPYTTSEDRLVDQVNYYVRFTCAA